MNFYAILGMGKIPQIEPTTRKIASNAEKLNFEVPDLMTSRFKNPHGAHFYNSTPNNHGCIKEFVVF